MSSGQLFQPFIGWYFLPESCGLQGVFFSWRWNKNFILLKVKLTVYISHPKECFCRKPPRYYFVPQPAEFHLVATHALISHSGLPSGKQSHGTCWIQTPCQTNNNLNFNHNVARRATTTGVRTTATATTHQKQDSGNFYNGNGNYS